jgi:hypothetical protein
LIDQAEIASRLPRILFQFEARVELARRWAEDISADIRDRAAIREGLFFYLTHEDLHPSMTLRHIINGLRVLRSGEGWKFDMIMENPENIRLPNDRAAILDAIRTEEEFFHRTGEKNGKK